MTGHSSEVLLMSTTKKRKKGLAFRPTPQCFGGADQDRTDDLLNAIQALSQLSYSPVQKRFGLYQNGGKGVNTFFPKKLSGYLPLTLPDTCGYNPDTFAGVVKLVDAADSKSAGSNPMSVRFRPPAPTHNPIRFEIVHEAPRNRGFFFIRCPVASNAVY